MLKHDQTLDDIDPDNFEINHVWSREELKQLQVGLKKYGKNYN